MPRIDPLDLLKCLGVLLSPTGGIKGQVEVERVARLMLRFSKKLVSKCIYIHVLKATPPELLDSFVSKPSSWYLLLTWLTDALQTHNTPLLVEMLELLLLCPMTEERLKDSEITALIQAKLNRNDLEQLIQFVAQQYNDQNCRSLATQLWSRWFVKPSDPNQFGMSQDAANILPDDIDLSIYAPDASSANYGDTLSLNIGDEVNSISNLSTLDMASYAPYMENNDYYNVSHVEPVIPMNNNMTSDSSQAYMGGAVGYVNEPVMQQQQHIQQDQQMHMHQHPVLTQAVEMNHNAIKIENTNEWSNGVTAVEHTIPNNIVSVPVIETPSTEASSSVALPALKIKVSKLGQQYVVNNEEVNGPAAAAAALPPPLAPTDQADGSSKEKDASKEKLSKDRKKEKDKKSSGSGSSSSSSSKTKSEESSKKSSDSKRREKEREKSKSSSKDGSSKSSSSSSSSKDKSKSKESDSKSKSKSSSRSEAQSKEAQQAQKNLQTLATIKAMTTPTVKLAKIPRKRPEESAGGGDAVTAATAATAAASAATDALDKLTPRPKTVKTFNSKFRSTGLVDETSKGSPVTKKLPPVSSEKKLSPNIKRPGTTEGLTQPVEKKLKPIDDTAITAAVAAVMKKTATDAKPAVKLISPRPRPFTSSSAFHGENKPWQSEDPPLPFIQDSSLFMDALEAGSKATTEPRKRKRSSSSSTKDSASTPSSGDPAVVASGAAVTAAVTVKTETGVSGDASSPLPVKPMFKFYQDTLETEEVVKQEKSANESAENKENKDQDEDKQSPSGIKESEEEEISSDGAKVEGLVDDSSQSADNTGKPKGVLVIHSQMKRRVKKSVQWRAEDELEMHHFFELDETERVNVNKLLFGEMKQAEREREKEAVKMSKQYVEEPEVEEHPWRGLIPIDIPEDRAIFGENSKEREIQEARENSTLQALYFKGQTLPDSPAEPDLEVPLERTDTAPVVIPLDDVTGNPESVYDHRHLPWPEPKLPPYGLPHPMQQQHMLHPQHQPQLHVQPPHMQQPYQPPIQQQQQFAPPFRNAGPMDQPFDHHGPTREMPLHQEPSMLHQLHNRHPQGRGGQWNDGPIDDGGPRGDQGGTWMAGDGQVYPDDQDQLHYNDNGPPFRDGPPHHRDNFHNRDREHPPRRDRGFNDMMDRPTGQRFMGPPRGMGMDGPRPRFHGPPRGGSRPGGPDRWGARNPTNQPCWHFMRGFCRLESNCKFLHTT